MRPGAIVNVSDFESDLYCKDGKVIKINGDQVVVMFLFLEKESVTGINCIVERFSKNQLYEMKSKRKLKVLRGL